MENLFGPQNCAYLARILAWVFAIPLHEVCHGWVSDKLGDHTARDAGRLTLNPLKHLDPLGLLSMLFIGVGWAKPVPVNPSFYKNRKGGMALTALAGPMSNLLLALVVMVPYKVYDDLSVLRYASYDPAAWPLWASVILYVAYFFIFININLALFNLLPIPPLDGSRIWGVVLPEKAYFGIMRYERYIMMALLAAVFILPRVLGFNPLGWLLGPVSDAVFNFMSRITGFIDTLIFGNALILS